uniref:Progesterone receptor membrane component 2 n=1 Tax=Bubo bubo TaxID=30461 RepID=A0A8C0IG92_BUBBB
AQSLHEAAAPYGIFAGRDASRGLGTFSLDKDALRDEYDDLSDLNAVHIQSVREWEMQFKEKYDYVGRLLKPGEEPSEYTDKEDSPPRTMTTDDAASAGRGVVRTS